MNAVLPVCIHVHTCTYCVESYHKFEVVLPIFGTIRLVEPQRPPAGVRGVQGETATALNIYKYIHVHTYMYSAVYV